MSGSARGFRGTLFPSGPLCVGVPYIGAICSTGCRHPPYVGALYIEIPLYMVSPTGPIRRMGKSCGGHVEKMRSISSVSPVH